MTRRSLVLSSLHGDQDDDADDTMIDLQGWMYWQASEKTSILGKPSWKRKWIVLTPDAIFIYKSDKVRGLILMEADFVGRFQSANGFLSTRQLRYLPYSRTNKEIPLRIISHS